MTADVRHGEADGPTTRSHAPGRPAPTVCRNSSVQTVLSLREERNPATGQIITSGLAAGVTSWFVPPPAQARHPTTHPALRWAAVNLD
ncbi:MAG: hypothetical protein ABW185_10210 [Sedimenticola sp.]